MQIHLLESTSAASPLSRNFGSHKLQLCMMVLSELRSRYLGADLAYRLFEQAEAKLHGHRGPHQRNPQTNDVTTNNNLVNPATSIVPLTPDSSTSQMKPAETQQAYSDNISFDPEKFIFDPFALSSMVDLGSCSGFDPALVLEDGDGRGDLGTAASQQNLSSDTDLSLDCGINSFLTAEEFNFQYLDMAQQR
jgi:hypothetical protein